MPCMKESSKPIKQDCNTCSLSKLCLPLSLTTEETSALENIIKKQQTVKRGDYLFHYKDPFKFIYAIRSGSFKTCHSNSEGLETISGFYISGELLGFDAIHGKQYPDAAIALETSSVCQIPFDDLTLLGETIPKLHRQIIDLMSQKMSNKQIVNPNASAMARLAHFLLTLSARFQRRGYSPREFSLSMSRAEMGTFLGIATETVSRLFSKLQTDKIVESHHRQVILQDMRQLQILSCEDE